MRIGVLALQGDFAKHAKVLRSLGVEALEVRKPSDLLDCDGLIIPGASQPSSCVSLNLSRCGSH